MPKYFADSWYWVALINKRDPYHKQAMAISDEIGDEPIATSHMVFVEVLGHFTKDKVQHLRKLAVSTIESLKTLETITIVSQTPEQFDEALKLYDQYQDKLWSLTDCASILIMQANGITIALTLDHHFVQAKYQIRIS